MDIASLDNSKKNKPTDASLSHGRNDYSAMLRSSSCKTPATSTIQSILARRFSQDSSKVGSYKGSRENTKKGVSVKKTGRKPRTGIVQKRKR